MDEKSGLVILKRLPDWIKSNMGRRILIVIGLIGILLIGLSTFLPDGKKEKATSGKTVKTAEEFVAETEERLTEIIGSIEGAGNCRVMVTLENGVEYIYAVEQDINTDRQEDSNRISEREDNRESVIVVDTENGRQGLLVTEIQPTVKGVAVVCKGGDQPLVQQRIINTITTVLNISSKRVCVTKLSD
ncbi:MAG: hypothetical protein PHH84_03010 [Oscillospiraceae bacterium]|nr:hypothetical protein [Oscillospiraceae bacterium]MDD4413653.1 hypothetical protein [Oscillospiraceae bacterium]